MGTAEQHTAAWHEATARHAWVQAGWEARHPACSGRPSNWTGRGGAVMLGL